MSWALYSSSFGISAYGLETYVYIFIEVAVVVRVVIGISGYGN